jgi:transposase
MSNHKYAAEFREEAVRQVLERGYWVKEVADNLGVSRHSLYKWAREAKPSPRKQKEEELLEAKREVLKLRAELRRAQEERDILKKPPRTMRESPSKVRIHRSTPQGASHPDDVPGARRGAQWVLCVASSAAVGPSATGPPFARAHPRLVVCERWYLRQPPGLGRPSRIGHSMRMKADKATRQPWRKSGNVQRGSQ